MMKLNYQAIVNNRIRGFILKTVKLGDPGFVGDDVINDCLASSGVFLSSGQLDSFLNYLKDSGYVTLDRAGPKDMAIFPQRRWNLKLTPKGQLILEGAGSDDGVTLEGPIE